MRSILLLSALLIVVCSYAQSSKPDYRITVGVNFRNPVAGNSQSMIFPVIHFQKKTSQKTLAGGINVGVSRFFPLTSRIDLKTTAGLSRQVYWELPTQFNKGPNPQDKLGSATAPTIEYYLAASGVVHFNFGRFSPGVGLAFEGLILSTLKFTNIETFAGGPSSIQNYHNKEYKPIMPVLPVELSWKGDVMLYNIRYEMGLLNRFRGSLSNSSRSYYGLMCFEIGMRI
jgi:hypothetical protein